MPQANLQALRDLMAQGRYRDALDLYQREAGPRLAGPPEVRLAAAEAAARVGEYATAATLAGSVRKNGTDGEQAIRAANLLGGIAFEQGRMRDAQHLFAEALDRAGTLGRRDVMAKASQNLANVLHLRGHPEVARNLYEWALLEYQAMGDARGTAETRHNLGLAARQAGDLDRAALEADDAVAAAEAHGDLGLLALTLAGRAETHVERNRFSAARADLDRSGRISAAAGDQVGRAEVGRLRALLHLRQRDWTTALREAEAAEPQAAELGTPVLRAECAAVSALSLVGLGRMAEAQARRDRVELDLGTAGATLLLRQFRADWAGIVEAA